MFTPLVSGPIVRYSEIAIELNLKNNNFVKFYYGVYCDIYIIDLL